MHLHLAFHLGTLDEPREGHDVGAKPEDGVWWTYPKDRRTLSMRDPWDPPQGRRTSLTRILPL